MKFWKRTLPALLAILFCLQTKAQGLFLDQELENFAWITNTNGVTWKREIDSLGHLHFPSITPFLDTTIYLAGIAEIVVPEHVYISSISLWGCVNLTNIILYPASPQRNTVSEPALIINAYNSGLRTITCQKTMRDRIVLWGDVRFQAGEWAILQWPVQWTELPNIEIKTHATDNGKELEVIWEDGTLQITDAISGEWRDYSGSSPLRVPLWLAAKDKQFFRIKLEEEEEEE